MSQFVLDARSVASLVFPLEACGLTEQLFRKRDEILMLRFVAVVRTVLTDAPALARDTGLPESFRRLCSGSRAAQRALLAYPSFGFWVDVMEALLRRSAHLKFPDLHVSRHLQSLQRFAAAQSLIDRRNDQFRSLETNGDGALAFPGTGTVLRVRGVGAYGSVGCELMDGAVVAAAEDGSSGPGSFSCDRVPTVLAGRVELNSSDEDLRLPGRTSYQYETVRAEDFPRWESALADAWDLITASSALLAGEMTLGIRVIVPVVSASPQTHSSASFQEAPGLLALSWNPDPLVLAEALVHEYHHQKLNALLASAQLIDGPEQQTYYSPWRSDPRPLSGILHGVYVFLAVLEWLNTLTPGTLPTLTTDRLMRRQFILRGQLRSALDTLNASDRLTVPGQWLCKAMAGRLNLHSSGAPEAPPSDARDMENRLEAHRKEWEQAHSVASRLSVSGAVANRSLGPQELQCLALMGLKMLYRDGEARIAVGSEVMLERITRLPEEKIAELRVALGEPSIGDSALSLTIRAHLSYTTEDFSSAAEYYARALLFDRSSPGLWQALAFALRHQGRWEESSILLANIGSVAAMTAELPTLARAECGDLPARLVSIARAAIAAL